MIYWYKNGRLLASDSNIAIADDMRTVTIKHMNLESQGNFMCEVRNEFNRKVFFSKVNMFGLGKVTNFTIINFIFFLITALIKNDGKNLYSLKIFTN